MKAINKIVLVLITIFTITCLYLILSFRFRPTGLTGIEYNVTSKDQITDFDDKNYIFIVNHDNPVTSDIVIMSNEVNKMNNRFNFVASGSAGGNTGDTKTKPKLFRRYTPYLTKYNIIWTSDGNTIERCKTRINKKENVLFFLKKEHKGKGIHHLIKDTKSDIILVNKVNHSDSIEDLKEVTQPLKYVLEMGRMKFDIQYEKVSINTDNYTPEQTLDYIKGKLFKST